MQSKTGKQKFDARVAELRSRGFEIKVTTEATAMGSVETAVITAGQWAHYCACNLFGEQFAPNKRFARKSTQP